MYILAIANQKGGVAKTTTCINLAASLVHKGQRVLMVDLDPQANATTGSGIDKNALVTTINQVLLGEASVPAISQTTPGGYELLPANGDLTQAELALLELPTREFRLREALSQVEADYDYVLLDCPPSLNMLTVNALVAAQQVIIPVQCEFYALEGLTALLNTVEHIQRSVNPGLSIGGILRTMYDGRNTLTNEVSKQLQTVFGNKVFATVIPRNVRLAEAPSYGLPAILYDAAASGAKAYVDLAEEIITAA